MFEKASEEFSLIKLFSAQVFPQELELFYYPELKEEVKILIKNDSQLTYKISLMKECKDICGYLQIYENNVFIYEVPLYPCWIKK